MSLRNLDRRLVTILLIVFVQIVGASLVLPILPLFAKREFAMPPQVITVLVASFFAAQFVAGPFLGRWSDRVGRVPILIISQIGTVISFVMLALAPNVATLFAARILDGITGGNIIVAQAYVTDVTPPKQRTQALGLIFASFGVGFIIGPALGGLLSAAFGPRVPFLLAATAATLVVILTWRTLDETLTAEQRLAARQARSSSTSIPQMLRNSNLVMILLLGFAGQIVLGVLQATFALYGEAVIFAGYGAQAVNVGIGLLLATVGVGQTLTQFFILPRLIRRYSDAILVLIGTTLRGVAMLIYASILTPWIGIAGSLFFALGQGINFPPLQSLATRTVGDNDRGAVLGLFTSVSSLGTIFSTAIGGTLLALQPRLPYWLGTLLSFLLILPALALYRRHLPAAGEAQPAGEAPPLD